MDKKKPSFPLSTVIQDFIKLESVGGILLLIVSVIALVIANSPLSHLYNAFLEMTVSVQFGSLIISKPLLLWINDGLMAVFFFLIGLEVKREVLEGELSSFSQVILPAIGALGGMIVPAAIYSWINWNDPVALNGWAIPVATDIAFALALLGVFSRRVPVALKVFLLTLAIFDDLAAIVIIAIFYSGDLSMNALSVGMAAFVVGIIMNRVGVTRTSFYLFLGVICWVAILKSGVHATLAGVLIAFCIPIRDKEGASPLRDLEHNLHGAVAYIILPLFAFANAGLTVLQVSVVDIVNPMTLGVVLGLVVGKPLGILVFVGAAVFLRLARLPNNVTWAQLFGVALACGIGFTMSLFIAGLAFEHGHGAGVSGFSADRLGILIGSILSAIAAYIVLRMSLPKTESCD